VSKNRGNRRNVSGDAGGEKCPITLHITAVVSAVATYGVLEHVPHQFSAHLFFPVPSHLFKATRQCCRSWYRTGPL